MALTLPSFPALGLSLRAFLSLSEAVVKRCDKRSFDGSGKNLMSPMVFCHARLPKAI